MIGSDIAKIKFCWLYIFFLGINFYEDMMYNREKAADSTAGQALSLFQALNQRIEICTRASAVG